MIKKTFLLFFVVSNLILAQYPVEIQKGLDKSYNLDFKGAEEIFDQYIKDNPDDPLGYHFTSQIYMMSYLGSKEFEDFSLFKDYSTVAIEKAEQKLDENPEDILTLNLLGMNYSFRAMAETVYGSSFDAFWSAKNSVEYFEDALDVNPKFYDAYMGLGLFSYALSFVPQFFHWAISITGLTADKQMGLEYLRKAYKFGKYNKTESAFHLSKVYAEYVAEYDSSALIIKKLLKKFPDNSLFHYQFAIAQLKARNLSEAEKSLNRVLEINHPKFILTNSLSNFLLGDIYFRRNDYAQALNYYNLFLTSTKSIDYTGIANYRIAICYEILGMHDTAMQYLLLARNGNLDIHDDAYAKLRSEQIYDNGFDENEALVFRGQNYLEAGEYDKSVEVLLEKVDSIKNDLVKARGLLFLSESLIELDRNEEAIYFLLKILDLGRNYNDWIFPHVHYLLARAYFNIDEFEKAEEEYKISESNNEFLFKDALQGRLNKFKRKLNEKSSIN